MTAAPPSAGRVPAVFFDKDGTLVENEPYNVDPSLVRLAPGAGLALRAVRDADFRVVVVSNQSGVARGYFEESALRAVTDRLRRLLASEGVTLDGFYYCPHHPDGTVQRYAVRCSCRKPAPGLLVRAADELRLDLGASWMVGDILDDVEAGHRAGCRAIFVDVGHETEWVAGEGRTPDATVPDLESAARVIVADRRAAAARA